MCDGRSIWTIDCRKLDDPNNKRSLRKHIGRNPKITKSIVESENYHALHSRLYDGMHWFFSSRNIVIMICRSGRHRSVANAELWSNTLTCCGRHQHSVSLLHLGKHVCRKLFGMQQTVSQIFQTHYDQVQAECLRLVPVPDPVTGGWKRPRPEHTEGLARQLHEEDNLRKLRKSKREVPQPHLPRRARVAELQTNWQSDSETFTIAPVHWPVVYRNTTSPVKQTIV